jgi:diadenosine tetraphosphate (Ap4A) HIT family hydrolase
MGETHCGTASTLAGTIHFMDQHDCPFCRLERSRIRVESEFAVSLLDGFPITQGHTLVIPKRHVASLFELSDEEQAAVWKLVAQVRASLAAELQPDGFNVGINDGTASGQTVMHAHVHIIPRHTGDVADPRGGVRWIMPDKARYWDEGQK